LLYQPHLGKKAGLDLMAGIGSGNTRFYQPGASTPVTPITSAPITSWSISAAASAITSITMSLSAPRFTTITFQSNSNVNNNGAFNTDNVFRVSASVGYTFGGSD